MNGSLSQFKATQRRRADRKEQAKGKFSKNHLNYKDSESKTEYNFPSLEHDELENLKHSIKANLKSEKRKNFSIVFSLTVIIVIFIYFFVLS
ncbi:hypothetical protein [Psychroserpens algicola]|uniref:hypothetical protein n=1 Tax=Psychroserpens algicola TaxID=1719034 RepID=UPI001953773F|nr:hypothetical protein [Psychroserpens algicola]